MKRLITFFIVQIFIFAICLSPCTAHAYDEPSTSISDVADIWIELRESSKLLVNNEGFLYVVDNKYVNHPAYESFLKAIEQCNLSISEGITIATESVHLEFTEEIASTYEELNNIRAAFEQPDSVSFIAEFDNNIQEPGASVFVYVPPSAENDDGGGHFCSRCNIDIITLCESNYQSLVTYYESMLLANLVGSTVDPWTSTVALWLNRVRPNGVWDYKVSDTYGPYDNPLCSYYDYEYHHFTAEYLGNFNYGYTGSFLFSLGTLHFGSSAVSGFNAADQADWPAIDDGFYAKTG